MATGQIKAGRELDRLIAVEVFGLVQCANPKAHPSENPFYDYFCMADADSPTQGGELRMYSEMFEDMGAVLRRMQELGWAIELSNMGTGAFWEAAFWLPGGPHVDASSGSLSHAVALAALAAVRA